MRMLRVEPSIPMRYGIRRTLDFGMFKGEKISDIIHEPRGRSWLMWAEANVQAFKLHNHVIKKLKDLNYKYQQTLLLEPEINSLFHKEVKKRLRNDSTGSIFHYRDKRDYNDQHLWDEFERNGGEEIF